ncbi:2-oxo-4-hydroxy-4-carboxy-5-ureidoimidazoline decarboxylase [uncultured Pleomorphomonas sp.]|uniref:2-oxo-4-hydroxy-4-carboxy-5-ureidoimidazoline decarboxylase n=1 Tax=uncultured Pleomorphomonas sp. TaxID=442121 RepID=A0A212KYQ1_9HYPH|nr:2-oxo-4-hydroxy-4-carboxy-5-ureidoimidazoline decarboxylase [uncultured Pleomorphomonas sp.]SCM70412.1 2-oxo-4-hydroxy-4-carboxy-5-ureidoimidazoline decarboxylase [uncultured Pleomorphomonas sp.]
MTLPMTVQDVNGLGAKAFMATFGDVAEYSPWVAETAEEMRPFSDRDAIVAAFEQALRGAGRAAKLALIRAHPDLATKAQSIADDSRREQAGAGLDALSPEEFARFETLNRTYRERFDFPFIFAVRGATKAQILDAFEERLGNSPEAEFERALDEIARIFRFRIEDRVAS